MPSNTETNRKLLNYLADQGFTAEIPGCFGKSALLRWGGVTGEDWDNAIIPAFKNLKQEDWYLFEIGRNCGTVFSADCVKSIVLKGSHAIILLKG